MNERMPEMAPESPHALAPGEVAAALETDERRGLAAGEAGARHASLGPNRLPRRKRPAYVTLALRQLVDPLVALLVAAAAISAAIGDTLEAAVIGAILLLNAALGFVQEAAAERALLALRGSFTHTASVVRDGRERVVAADELVPGDLVVLREGDRVPADARVVSAERLEADEAPLTGESLPVDKGPAAVAEPSLLADRSSMIFAGTAVTRGHGTALVTAIGEATELGAISRLAGEAKRPPTPLQRRLGRLAQGMVALGVAITVLLAGVMLLRGASLHESFLLGVAVAVAAVPEGLAATVTIALALGARAMARCGALVRRLAAIEALGETTVICTDKTGTLTENRLRLAAALPTGGATEERLLAAAVLASAAELLEERGRLRVVGDPVEGALLLAARERGISRHDLVARMSHVYEIPFEPERKLMTVVYEEDGRRTAYVKGAPEIMLDRAALSEADRGRLAQAAGAWAREGLRVLAVGERALPHGTELDGTVEQDVSLLGLVALHDPLRPGSAAAVADAQAAGIRVEMLTGDHPATARSVGLSLKLPDDAIHARVTPRDKLRLVEALQARGEIVAVTGDGVNDAPALRRADVGISMGLSGTEVAREASDIVLTDDNFSTIVAALREGRRIADNVRKVVAFLLSANLGEVVLFAVAVLAGLGAPMTVVQVLTVNLLTDGVPALALVRDASSPWSMANGPRSRGALFSRALWGALAAGGTLVGLAGLGAYLAGRELDPDAAQTMAFATIALAELAFVFAARSLREPAWRVPGNPALAGGVAVSALLVALVVYVPPLQEPFGTVSLGPEALGIVLALALVPFVAVELGKRVLRRQSRP